MFTSRVKPAAIDAGVEISFPGFEAADFSEPVDLVIFDLDSVSGEELAASMKQLSKMDPIPRSVAYGPHVKEGRLNQARECGVQKVMTRGQFNRNFPKLFQSAG